VFLYLKHFSSKTTIDSLYSNYFIKQSEEIVKEQIVLNRIKTALKGIYDCYDKSINIIKSKQFIKWKSKAFHIKYIKQLMPNIKEKYNKKFNARKEEIESQCKQQENVVNNLKSQIHNINDVITKTKSTIKSNEENEMKLNKTIKSLEESNLKLEQEIKKVVESTNANCNVKGDGNVNSNSNHKNKKQLEKKIKELTEQKRKLNEEMEELDAYFSIQVKEMNEMLDDFEEKAHQLNNLQRLK
jgi:chromosome segregation ATPase